LALTKSATIKEGEMGTEKIGFFNENVRSFYDQAKTGIFLFNLLPKSPVAVYHDLSPVKGLGNGVVILGPKEDQEKLGTTIAENLLYKNQSDGFWSSAVFLEDKLVIVYAYQKELEPDQIIELLSLKLRYDLLHHCGIELAPLSFLLVKVKGQIRQNIPIRMPPKLELLQSLKQTAFFNS